MGSLQKLSEAHVAHIYRLVALGVAYREIARRLETGVETGTGASLPAVSISEGAVRHHVSSEAGIAAIENERERLYGDARAHPSYWIGWRIGKLEDQLEDAIRLRRDGDLTPSERARWAEIALRTHDQIRKQYADLAGRRRPTDPASAGARHLHLHGDVAGNIARQMQELASAGLLEGALDRIAGRNEEDAGEGARDERHPGGPPFDAERSRVGPNGVPPTSPCGSEDEPENSEKSTESDESAEGGAEQQDEPEGG